MQFIVLESKNDLLNLEPELHDSVLGGLYCPQDAHVQAGSFVQALSRRLKQRGVVFEEKTKVCKLNIQEGKLKSIETNIIIELTNVYKKSK